MSNSIEANILILVIACFVVPLGIGWFIGTQNEPDGLISVWGGVGLITGFVLPWVAFQSGIVGKVQGSSDANVLNAIGGAYGWSFLVMIPLGLVIGYYIGKPKENT